MQSSQIWKLFEKTGNIGVYILYKKMSDAENKAVTGEENKGNADSNRGNRD